MLVKVELPDALVDELYRGSEARNLTPDQYVSEMLYQLLAERSLGDDAQLSNRPDWQTALDRARSDIEAGRTRTHQEAVDWHMNQRG
jgi:predicted transcriptional regulator